MKQILSLFLGIRQEVSCFRIPNTHFFRRFVPPWTLSAFYPQDQATTRLSEAETKMNGASEVHQSKAGPTPSGCLWGCPWNVKMNKTGEML